MIKKQLRKSFFARLMTLLVLALMSTANVWGKDYTKLFTIKSSDVVSNSGYSTYTKGADADLYNTSWIITFGGNNKSVGTNEKNRSKCTLSSNSKYAVSPVTTSDIASAFVSTASISDIAKISYTFSGGSNQTSTDVYLIYSSDGNTFSQISLTSGTQGATISSGAAFEFTKCSGYFGLLFKATNSSGNWRIDDVDITFYNETSAPAAVATPTITSAETDFMESASVSITCDTEGASIYYTLDGTDPTKSSTLYTEPFNITETTTVKAIAYKDSEASDIATKLYTKITPLATMDDIFKASTTAGSYWIIFNNWVVSGVKGSNAYITDNNGKGLILYKSSHGFVAGDVLNGTVKCALTTYYGSAEITDLTSTTTGLTVTKGGTLNTIKTTIEALGGVNTGAYVDLGVLTYNGESFVDASKNEIKPYHTFITLPTLTKDVKYNVKGIYIQYNTTKEIAPLATTDFEEAATTKYKIEIDELQNGTITANLAEAAEGAEITLTIEPAEHYRMQSNSLIVLDSKAQNVPVTDSKFTMPASDVLVSAEFEPIPTHVAKFFVNGKQYGETQTLEEESDVVFPENPADISGKTFVGWTASTIEDVIQEAPEFVTSATMGTADLNYYAVYANTNGSSGNYEKVTSALSDWCGKYLIVYEEGNLAFDGSLETLDAVGNTKAVTISNNVIAASTEMDAIAFTVAYKTGESTVYSLKSASGKYISGTTTNAKASNGLKQADTDTNYEISFNGTAIESKSSDQQMQLKYNKASDQTRFRFYKSGQQSVALYKKQEATYSNYCTTIPRTYNVSISSVGYATLGLAYAVEIPSGVTAYAAKKNSSSVALTEIEGGVIPANCGVVLKAESGDYTFVETNDVNLALDNELVAATEAVDLESGFAYLLAQKDDNTVVFRLCNAGTLAAGKAYLPAPVNAKFELPIGDETTGIEDVDNSQIASKSQLYNLNGMRVNENYKGVTIMNGKKYLAK